MYTCKKSGYVDYNEIDSYIVVHNFLVDDQSQKYSKLQHHHKDGSAFCPFSIVHSNNSQHGLMHKKDPKNQPPAAVYQYNYEELPYYKMRLPQN